MIAWLEPVTPPNSIDHIPFGLLLSLVFSVLAVIEVITFSPRRTVLSSRLGTGVVGSVDGIMITCLPFIAQLFITFSLTAETPNRLPSWWPWPKPASALFIGTFAGFFLGYQLAILWTHPKPHETCRHP